MFDRAAASGAQGVSSSDPAAQAGALGWEGPRQPLASETWVLRQDRGESATASNSGPRHARAMAEGHQRGGGWVLSESDGMSFAMAMRAAGVITGAAGAQRAIFGPSSDPSLPTNVRIPGNGHPLFVLLGLKMVLRDLWRVSSKEGVGLLEASRSIGHERGTPVRRAGMSRVRFALLRPRPVGVVSAEGAT